MVIAFQTEALIGLGVFTVLVRSRDRKIGVSFNPRARKGLTVDFNRPIPHEYSSLRRKVKKWYAIREKEGFAASVSGRFVPMNLSYSDDSYPGKCLCLF